MYFQLYVRLCFMGEIPFFSKVMHCFFSRTSYTSFANKSLLSYPFWTWINKNIAYQFTKFKEFKNLDKGKGRTGSPCLESSRNFARVSENYSYGNEGEGDIANRVNKNIWLIIVSLLERYLSLLVLPSSSVLCMFEYWVVKLMPCVLKCVLVMWWAYCMQAPIFGLLLSSDLVQEVQRKFILI